MRRTPFAAVGRNSFDQGLADEETDFHVTHPEDFSSVPLATAILVVLSLFTPTPADTWNVYEDGTGDAPFIQAAIDSSADGDSVVVWAGTYNENLAVEGKSISLIAPEGPETTTLVREVELPVLEMYGNNTFDIMVSGFSFDSDGGMREAMWIVHARWFMIRARETVFTSIFCPRAFPYCTRTDRGSSMPPA